MQLLDDDISVARLNIPRLRGPINCKDVDEQEDYEYPFSSYNDSHMN